MIRTVLALLPEGSRRTVTAHLALTVLSVIARALSAVLLVPLLGALFGPAPPPPGPGREASCSRP